VSTSGSPVTSELHVVHWPPLTPSTNRCSGPFGTYTTTLGTGSGVPKVGIVPAMTVPVTVVGVPPSQLTCCLQRPTHCVPHWNGVPPPPHVSGSVQVPQPPAMSPPQPSPT